MVLSVLLAALVPASARAGEVDAGALRVRTEGAGLTFVDRAGATVLAGRSLGFRTRLGPAHATRILSERRAGAGIALRLATSDPLGRTLAVVVTPDGDGAIRVVANVEGVIADVTASDASFAARTDERYLGFGERSNAVDQRGHTVVDRTVDGPYQPDERTVVPALVPPAGVGGRDDDTYFPMPWLLSTAGYGVLVENPETSTFHLGSDDRSVWSVEAAAPRLSFRVLAGPRPADVVRRLTARLGRQPAAAPWFLGPWYQPRKGDEAGELDRMLAAHVPLTLAQTYTHHLPCGDQRGKEKAEADRVARFHAAGLAITTYFNPMICQGYDPVFSEAVHRGALTRTAAGAPYLYRYTGSTTFLVGQFDFLTDAGRDIYGRLLGEALGRGYDGWMEDFGEYTPDDSRSGPGSGVSGAAEHNLYPLHYHCAAYAAVTRAVRRPVARFQRSGWTGAAPCATVVWGGDPTTGYGFDGLASAVKQGLTMGLSGISRWGSDVGGFFSLAGRKLTPELLIRWIELGAVSGVMRTQANGFSLPSGGPRPQLSDPEILPYWRRWARWRTRLYPYIAAADAGYERTGLPVMRHLALAYPDDPRATAREDEFLFGPDLLAAPVLVPGARSRTLYLPAGRWVDLGVMKLNGATGRVQLGRARTVRGGRDATVAAPLGRLPLLARAGTILPLLPRDTGTLTEYGDGRRQVRLSDRTSRELLVFPRGRSTAAIGQGERAASRERHGAWALTLRSRIRRRFTVQAALGTLARPFRPCRVIVGGRPLPRRSWRYDRRSRVLIVSFRLRRGTVRALRRCG